VAQINAWVHHHVVVTVLMQRVRVVSGQMLMRLHHRLVARTTMQHRHHGPALDRQGQQQEPQDEMTKTS
jgi:hypothetical protein